VERLMREQGLKARRKKSGVNTTDSRYSLPAAEDLLNRDLRARGPGEQRAAVCDGDTRVMGSYRDRMGMFRGQRSRSCMRRAYDGLHEPQAGEGSALLFRPGSTVL
jgi:transposase InsO family protein